MSKEKFVKLTSRAVPIAVQNIDTDQIIPARFLKATTREGFGDHLFCDWRYDSANQPIKDFVLNDSKYSGKILVAGKNFGCGSSREHAAWSIYDYGFRVVVSSFFADIFKNNSLNIGILPAQVSEVFLNKLFTAIEADPDTPIEVNLPDQTITILATGEKESFTITGYKKHNMINGYDDIDFMQSLKNDIKAHADKSIY